MEVNIVNICQEKSLKSPIISIHLASLMKLIQIPRYILDVSQRHANANETRQ